MISSLEQAIASGQGNLKQVTNLQYQYENTVLENPTLASADGGTDLKAVTKSGPVLIYRVTSTSCDVCHDYISKLLSQMSEPSWTEKFLVIVPIKEFRKTVAAFQAQNIKARILAVNDESAFGIPMEKESSPFFFITDSSLTLSHLLIPHKNGAEITEEYLKVMQSKFLNR